MALQFTYGLYYPVPVVDVNEEVMSSVRSVRLMSKFCVLNSAIVFFCLQLMKTEKTSMEITTRRATPSPTTSSIKVCVSEVNESKHWQWQLVDGIGEV